MDWGGLIVGKHTGYGQRLGCRVGGWVAVLGPIRLDLISPILDPPWPVLISMMSDHLTGSDIIDIGPDLIRIRYHRYCIRSNLIRSHIVDIRSDLVGSNITLISDPIWYWWYQIRSDPIWYHWYQIWSDQIGYHRCQIWPDRTDMIDIRSDQI